MGGYDTVVQVVCGGGEGGGGGTFKVHMHTTLKRPTNTYSWGKLSTWGPLWRVTLRERVRERGRKGGGEREREGERGRERIGSSCMSHQLLYFIILMHTLILEAS